MVTGNARVFGDAEVTGNAEVFGVTEVTGKALVTGNAKEDLKESKPTPKILDTLPEGVTSITIDGVTYTKKTSWVAEEK